jgi:hypothetical protein
MGGGTQGDIHYAVAALLRHPARSDRLFTADSIAQLLNVALSIDDNAHSWFEMADVVKAIPGGDNEAILSYNDLGYEDDRCILSFRQVTVSSKRYYYIGRFQSDRHGRAATVEKETPQLCIISPSA